MPSRGAPCPSRPLLGRAVRARASISGGARSGGVGEPLDLATLLVDGDERRLEAGGLGAASSRRPLSITFGSTSSGGNKITPPSSPRRARSSRSASAVLHPDQQARPTSRAGSAAIRPGTQGRRPTAPTHPAVRPHRADDHPDDRRAGGGGSERPRGGDRRRRRPGSSRRAAAAGSVLRDGISAACGGCCRRSARPR